MAITLTADERAALRRGAVGVRALIDLYFTSGRYSFWDGDVIWNFEGQNYVPISEFGEISPISLGQDLGAEGIEIVVNGTRLVEAAGGTDPGALFGTIELEAYQMRRVEIRLAFFDIETGALLFLRRRYTGIIDQIRHEERRVESGAMNMFLVVGVESLARRYGTRLGRTRSHEDQQEIYPGDEFFKFTMASGATRPALVWGRKSAQTGGGGGVVDRTIRTVLN